MVTGGGSYLKYVRRATLLNCSDFLFQKLQSYGEVLNLRAAMALVAPLFPPPMLMAKFGNQYKVML